MGCDIHSFVEIREAGAGWRPLDRDVFPLSEYDQRWRKQTHGRSPFDWRSYGMYGFLADVNNWSHVPTCADTGRGLPDDVSPEVRREYCGQPDQEWFGNAADDRCDGYGIGTTWLALAELLAFDYDKIFWNRRVTKQTGPRTWDGAALAEEGEGEHLSVREFLDKAFFRDLDILATLGAPEDVRVVCWFSC